MGSKRFEVRTWARWLATFVGFPLAGLAARAVAGSIDDARSALVGGLAAGAVLGAVQVVGLRPSRRTPISWIAATAIGLSVGLAAGAAAVGYATDTAGLVVMGALSGLGVGVAQAAVLIGSQMQRIVWALATPALWALGWLITSNVIEPGRQWATFGASGAFVVAGLGGVSLAIVPRSGAAATAPAQAAHTPSAVA